MAIAVVTRNAIRGGIPSGSGASEVIDCLNVTQGLTSGDTLFLSGAGAPSDGTSGTGAGTAGVGSVYINTTTGAWYRNTGTKASPTWTVFSGQGS